MPMAFRPARLWPLAFSLAAIAGCTSHHAYVGTRPGQPLRDVAIPSGATNLVPIAGSVVGAEYEERTDRLFLRLLPGTQLQEVDRPSGRVIRTFPARQVTAGCGGITPDQFPIVECGLAMRYSDRHLFLDHPSGVQIAELDVDGGFVRNIPLRQPDGPIGGLAFDQQAGTLYALFIRSRMIDEIDMQGNRIRRIRAFDPRTGAALMIERFGLAMNSHRRELYVALQNGTHVGVLDLNGGLKQSHALQSAGIVPGIGAGRRRGF
jgi:hypothetical protein